MKNSIKELLGLQGVWVDGWVTTQSRLTVTIRSPRLTALCIACGRMSKKVHQYHVRNIKHSIWQNRLVILKLTRRRFFCKHCCKPFSEWIPGITRKQSTGNFRSVLLKDLSRQSFTHVAKTTATSTTVLYDVLHEHSQSMQHIDWAAQKDGLTVGLDEHSFRGRRMAFTVTNISERKLLAIGPDNSRETVQAYLKSFKQEKITEICIDMQPMYAGLIKDILPSVRITVDKFHVIAYGNKMLDMVRSVVVGKKRVRRLLWKAKQHLTQQEQLKLVHLFHQYRQFPSLKEAYIIKEKLRAFYAAKTMEAAETKMDDLIMLCQTSHSRYSKDFGRTLARWREYILNHFVSGSTNAFTEGVHTKIKMLKRTSFGFRNVRHYAAKMMLGFLPFMLLCHHTN